MMSMSKISIYTCMVKKNIYLHFAAMPAFYGIMTNDTYSESSQRLETENQPFYLIKSVFLKKKRTCRCTKTEGS